MTFTVNLLTIAIWACVLYSLINGLTLISIGFGDHDGLLLLIGLFGFIAALGGIFYLI